MLPILDFSYLNDNDLITVEEFIQAINSISSVKINYRTIETLAKKSIIKIEYDLLNLRSTSQDIVKRFLGHPEEPPTIRISKADALKVLALAKKQEEEYRATIMEAASKPAKELVTTKIKPPKVEREGKAYSFIRACFLSHKGKPETLDELIRYCQANRVDGYTGIRTDSASKRGGKVKCNEHPEGITWASLRNVFNRFIEEQN